MTSLAPSDSKHRPGDGRLLLLDDADNVLVAIARLKAAEPFALDGAVIAPPSDIPVGHKIARRAIAAGETIVKYGAPIGSATADIAGGAHVHVHNVRSNYTPSYYLEEVAPDAGSRP